MKTIKLCKDCKWSIPDKQSPWALRCINLSVNSKNAWALSRAKFNGSDASDERSNRSWFAVCGMKGKLHEPK